MMTLSNFENFVPPHIWMRGEEYFESGAVTELEETESGKWIAQVEGTKDYEVEVSIEGKEIVYWDCDCPYDGDICKHIVAVILAIRENKSKEKRFLSANENICKYAEENVGRNHYEYIARILKETKKLKGGKALVQEIVEEFRVTYKRRPSMMEVLRNF